MQGRRPTGRIDPTHRVTELFSVTVHGHRPTARDRPDSPKRRAIWCDHARASSHRADRHDSRVAEPALPCESREQVDHGACPLPVMARAGGDPAGGPRPTTTAAAVGVAHAGDIARFAARHDCTVPRPDAAGGPPRGGQSCEG